jgi:hypothetical protein
MAADPCKERAAPGRIGPSSIRAGEDWTAIRRRIASASRPPSRWRTRALGSRGIAAVPCRWASVILSSRSISGNGAPSSCRSGAPPRALQGLRRYGDGPDHPVAAAGRPGDGVEPFGQFREVGHPPPVGGQLGDDDCPEASEFDRAVDDAPTPAAARRVIAAGHHPPGVRRLLARIARPSLATRGAWYGPAIASPPGSRAG